MRTRLVLLVAVLVAFCTGFIGQPSMSAMQNSGVVIVGAIAADIPMFATEEAAQKHCPSDTVVWLNTRSGIYHLKGERWYSRTKYGAYVCQKEANAAGYRETRNGQ